MPEVSLDEMPAFGPKLGNSTPFSVPEGYFEGLSGNILSKIKNQEIESASDEINRISPVLADLHKVNPFVLPEGYFENLEILDVVNPVREEKGRVVAMGSWKKWMNYAAAAVITAILAGAVYFNISSSGNSDPELSQAVAQIDTPESDSLDLSPEALSSFLEQTNSPVAEDFLEAAEIMEQKDLAILEVNETSIKSALENLEDGAIQDYILENPDAGLSSNSN